MKLLARGADLNARDASGATPLMTAAHWGRDDIAQLLLQRGADPKAALLMLAQGGMNLLVAFARHPPHYDLPDPLPTPAQVAMLQRFADQSDAALAWALLSKRVDARSREGSNALLLAAAAGNTAVVRALLDSGADANVQGTEALGRCRTWPSLPGFEWGRSEPSRMTPLMYAANHGHLDIVRALLNRGARAGIRDTAGMTALLYAAKDGYAPIVRVLLHRGADVRAECNKGKTALMLVAERGSVGVLASWTATWGGEAKHADAKRRAEYARWRASAFHAAAADDRAIVKAMLAGGCDVRARDRRGNTALMLATKAHHTAIGPLLDHAIHSRAHYLSREAQLATGQPELR